MLHYVYIIILLCILEKMQQLRRGKHASSYVGKLIKIKLFMFINSSPQLPQFKIKTNLNKKHQRDPVKSRDGIWSPYTPVVEVSCCVCIQVAAGLPVSCRTSCLETVYSSLKYFSQCWPAVWYYPISGLYSSQCQLRLSLCLFIKLFSSFLFLSVVRSFSFLLAFSGRAPPVTPSAG